MLRLIAAAAALAIIIAVLFPGNDAKPTAAAYGGHTLLIDAGHGGIDGGAESADGIKESDVNLSVALKMSELCKLLGIKHAMTREDANSIVPGEYSERAELLARADMANGIDGCVLISVHQNKYPSPNVKGAEVMYAGTTGSRDLGLMAQENLVSALDKQNRRVAHPAPEELLLTSRVECPAILAECGFMSNPQEASQLADDTYQMKIALSLTAAFVRWCGEAGAA